MFDWVKRLYQGAAKVDVDEAQWQSVERELDFLAFLPREAIDAARQIALSFLKHKEFYGANGLALDDRMMLSIALQASLPVLRLGGDAYRGWVGIVVYPGDFVARRREMGPDGVVHEFDDTLLGEARSDGPVLLSWFDVANRPHGVNVVIHEFAHKLDMLNGDVDGLPVLPPDMQPATWAAALAPAYEDFCRRIDLGEHTAIDPYASESPAEFFAVSAEAFFLTPLRLQSDYPQVYAQLSQLFGVDPAQGEARLMRERWLSKHRVNRE